MPTLVSPASPTTQSLPTVLTIFLAGNLRSSIWLVRSPPRNPTAACGDEERKTQPPLEGGGRGEGCVHLERNGRTHPSPQPWSALRPKPSRGEAEPS